MSSDVEYQLEILNKEVREIRSQLDRIEEILQNSIGKNCEKMGEHINFVENVYETVKSPLNYICNKINSISAISNSTPSSSNELIESTSDRIS